MTYLDYLEQKVLLERLVIGLEEPVLIKGLGELSAKIDSGNGGYNVIHGTDFHQQGNELMFTTHDSFGHEKKMQATVIDTIEVNMGGGNIESRPVIELDIKFAGEDYKKIPFSVSDRSSNTNPILISKGFVENELEALIDVGAMNISHDKIDVVYGEGFGDFVKNTGRVIGNVAKAPIIGANKLVNNGATKAVGKAIKGVENFGKWLSGDADADSWKPEFSKLTKKDKGMAEQIARASDTENKDASEVKTKMNNLTAFKKVKKDPKLDTTNNVIDELVENKKSPSDLPICLVTSFMMCKGAAADKSEIKGLEQDRESIKGWVDSNKEKVQEEKSNRQGGNQQKPQEQEEAPSTPATPQPPAQDSETPQEQGQQPQEQKQDDDFEEVTTFFEQLCQFTLWFVSFEKIKDNKKYEADFKKYIQAGTYDNVLMKMFKSGEISPQTIEPYVKELASLFQKDGKQGLFVLRWTPQSQTELKDDMKDIKRQTYFFEELVYIPYAKSDSSTPQFDKLEQEVEDKADEQQPEAQAEVTDETPADDAQPAQEEVTDGETTDAVEAETTDETPADGTETEETTDEETKTPEFDNVEKKINQQLPDEDPDEEWEKIRNEYLKNKKYSDIVK